VFVSLCEPKNGIQFETNSGISLRHLAVTRARVLLVRALTLPLSFPTQLLYSQPKPASLAGAGRPQWGKLLASTPTSGSDNVSPPCSSASLRRRRPRCCCCCCCQRRFGPLSPTYAGSLTATCDPSVTTVPLSIDVSNSIQKTVGVIGLTTPPHDATTRVDPCSRGCSSLARSLPTPITTCTPLR
jgi:hypothetical protein